MGNYIQSSNGYTVDDKDCSVNAHLLFNYLSQRIMLFTLWGTGAKHFVCKFCWKVWNWTNFTSQRKSERWFLHVSSLFVLMWDWKEKRRIKKFLGCLNCTVYIKEPLSPHLWSSRSQKKINLFNPIIDWINLSFCRQHQFAIRATLLSAETLKARNIYLDAAMQFMRMTAEVKKKFLIETLCCRYIELSDKSISHG